MSPTRDLTDPRRARGGLDLEATLRPPVYDNVSIPETFGPVQVIVDEAKVKRFAFVVDDFGDWYLGAGLEGRRIAHPGIVANDLLQLFTTVYAPSQVVGLHTEERLWIERPIEVGETLTLEGHYTDKYERRGQGYVVMEATATDAAGRPVVRHRGVEIMRTAPAEVGGRGSAADSAERRVRAEVDASLPLLLALGADARVGQGLLPMRKEVTVEQMAVFSRIGEYITNIHNDLGTARAAGLSSPIVQGQHLLCLVMQFMTRAFGAAWFHGSSIHAKFLRPVPACDLITLEGAVAGVERLGDRSEVEAEFWVRGEDGSIAVVGWATARIPADIRCIAA